MRHEAEDYSDQKKGGMEIGLDRITRTVKAGREKLRGITAAARRTSGPPPASVPEGGPAAEAARREDGFFDQDQT